MPDIGRKLGFGIAKETTRNTAMTSATVWMPWMTIDWNVKNDPWKDESAMGVADKLLSSDIMLQYVEGKLSGEIDADIVIQFLYYFFGSGSTTPVTTLSATTWTITRQNSPQLQTFTSFYPRQDTGNWYKVNGCIFKELKIKVDAGGHATIDGTIMGISETTASTQTPAYTAPSKYLLGKHGTFGYATTFSGLSSPTNFDVRGVEISFKNNSINDPALGSLYPVDIYSGSFETDLKVSAVAKTATIGTFDTDYKAGNKKAFKLTLTNSSASVIGTSALKPLLSIAFTKARYDVDYKTERDSMTMIDLKIMPELSVSDTFTTQLVVQNAVPTIL